MGDPPMFTRRSALTRLTVTISLWHHLIGTTRSCTGEKKTPPEHVGVVSRTKPKRFRLVRPYKAPFKLNPFWTVMLFAVLFVVIVAIAKRF